MVLVTHLILRFAIVQNKVQQKTKTKINHIQCILYMTITSRVFFYIFGGSGLLCGRSRCTAVGPRLALKLNIDSMTSLPGSLLEFQMFIEMPVVTYKEGLVQEFVLTTVKTVKTFLVDFSSSCLLKRFLFIMQLHFLPNKFLSGLS